MPLPLPAKPQSEHSRAVFRNSLDGETAYQRHQRYVRMVQSYGESSMGESSGVRRTDFDVLKDAHRFLRNDEEDESNLTYDESVALKYYRSLFKEFAICDLKHYKSGNFSLRWRTEDEVVDGIGQFTCGNPRCSRHTPEGMKKKKEKSLITLELPFGYSEEGEMKSALVKVVLCGRCKKKLTWKRDQEKAAVANIGTLAGASDEEDAEGADPEEPARSRGPLPSSNSPPPPHRSRRKADEHHDMRHSRRRISPTRRSASPPRRS